MTRTPAPACTVVIPWHRGLDDLARAVASVRAQTFADFEIVVVANGVDDAAWAAVEGLVDDPRYRTLRLAEPEVAAARNAGLDAARGDLVFFLDGDDAFHPGKLARFVDFHRETGFDLAWSRGRRVRGDGVAWAFPLETWDGTEPLSEYFFCHGHTASASAIVMDRRWIASVRFEPPPYEDPGLLLAAHEQGLTVAMLPDILYDWYDDRGAHRLSRALDAGTRLAWIERGEIGATPRAKAAFRARCVGQHLFPRRPVQSLRFFLHALATGAIPPREIALFVLRGLLPGGLRQRALNAYFLLKAGGARRVTSEGA